MHLLRATNSKKLLQLVCVCACACVGKWSCICLPADQEKLLDDRHVTGKQQVRAVGVVLAGLVALGAAPGSRDARGGAGPVGGVRRAVASAPVPGGVS